MQRLNILKKYNYKTVNMFNYRIFYPSLGVLFFLLQSCAVIQAPRNLVDTNKLDVNNGILVVGMHTNWEHHNISSIILRLLGKGKSWQEHTRLAFQGKEHIYVIALPANTYGFYQIAMGNRYSLLDWNQNFTIKSNTITYIGDINLDFDSSSIIAPRYGWKVDDRLDDIKKHLNQVYPNIVKKFLIEKQIINLLHAKNP